MNRENLFIYFGIDTQSMEILKLKGMMCFLFSILTVGDYSDLDRSVLLNFGLGTLNVDYFLNYIRYLLLVLFFFTKNVDLRGWSDKYL